MNFDRWDTVRAGLVLGLIAPMLGFVVYGLIYTNFIHPFYNMNWFVNDLFLGTRAFQAPVLSISLMANIPFFFLLNMQGHSLAMRGMLTSMFIYAGIIVILWI